MQITFHSIQGPSCIILKNFIFTIVIRLSGHLLCYWHQWWLPILIWLVREPLLAINKKGVTLWRWTESSKKSAHTDWENRKFANINPAKVSSISLSSSTSVPCKSPYSHTWDRLTACRASMETQKKTQVWSFQTNEI